MVHKPSLDTVKSKSFADNINRLIHFHLFFSCLRIHEHVQLLPEIICHKIRSTYSYAPQWLLKELWPAAFQFLIIRR